MFLSIDEHDSMRAIVFMSLLLGASLRAEGQSSARETFTHAAMGTKFAFTVYARPGDGGTTEVGRIVGEAFDAVDALERITSVWRTDTEVSYVNAHAASGPVTLSPQLLGLIQYCRKVHDDTQGAFDITVGPLVELWGFRRTDGRPPGNVPSNAELSNACARVGSEKLVVNAEKRTVLFGQEGMLLDFGGVGKGLALDMAADILRRNGVTSAALNAGSSSIVTIGAPPQEPGWKVAIRNPFNEQAALDEIVLRDEALATSADYENFVEVGGKKYGHILDPRTGRPVEGMASVTVIGPSGRDTDALSTAFFVMGIEKARTYCEEHRAFRAVLVPEVDRKPTRVGVWPECAR